MPARQIIGRTIVVVAAIACACVTESRGAELQGQPDAACRVEIGDACVDAQCVFEHDFVLRCPGDAGVDELQLALDGNRVWGSFRVQHAGVHAFRIAGDELELIDSLPRVASDCDESANPKLRPSGQRLALLSLTDAEHWSEVELAGTELHAGVCPLSYTSDSVCSPCMSATSGIEHGAHQLVRTDGGQLWGAYLVTDAIVDVQYSAKLLGSRWRCTGTPSTIASGFLHLVELDADASPLRSLELELDNVGFHPSGTRELAIAASGDRVAVMLPSQQHRAGHGRVAVRVLVFDTTKLE